MSETPAAFHDTAGSGPALVLLHGFLIDRRIWRHQLVDLAQVARVIAPDLRGFGQSRDDRPFTIAGLADDVAGLLDSLHIARAAVAGLSMGGYVALEFAARHRDRLAGLALVSSRADAESAAGRMNRNAMIAEATKGGAAALVEPMLARLTARTAAPSVVAELREMMLACRTPTIVAALAAMRDRADHMATLATLDVPAAVLVGDADVLISTELAAAAADALPQGKLTVVSGAGHTLPLERPVAVTAALRELIERADHPSS